MKIFTFIVQLVSLKFNSLRGTPTQAVFAVFNILKNILQRNLFNEILKIILYARKY